MNNTTTTYEQLSLAEREEIAIGREKGESFAAIGRHRSSISREVKRNGSPIRAVKYRANRAQLRSDGRKKASHAKQRPANPVIRGYVQSHMMHDGWTPEQIAGRLPVDIPELTANYESICLWIYRERRDLIPYLVQGHTQRRKRGNRKKTRIKIPHRTDICGRPAYISKRDQAGRREVDTIVSRQGRSCIAVPAERKCRLFPAIKIKDKTARSLRKAAAKALRRLPAKLRRTLTYDNGLENALHELTNTVWGTKSYFCKPFRSWEKGGIENRNGIFRRCFPEKYNFDLTSQRRIDKVIHKINSTPMKCWGFKTPLEVFSKLSGVALRH